MSEKKKKPRNSYTTDSRISFHVEMGRTESTEVQTVGEWLGLDSAELAALTDAKIGKQLGAAFDTWLANEISGGWSREEGT